MTRQEAKQIALKAINEAIEKHGENCVYMQSPKIGKNTWTLKEAKEAILNDTTLEDTNTNLIDGIIELDKFLKENGKKTTDI